MIRPGVTIKNAAQVILDVYILSYTLVQRSTYVYNQLQINRINMEWVCTRVLLPQQLRNIIHTSEKCFTHIKLLILLTFLQGEKCFTHIHTKYNEKIVVFR